ncbi:MAG: metallophosphoesterase family protein [Gemmatimonadota bacterium]|jgi:putative phosphoesterase
MRIAALYDIHGNLPALEAVLEEISDAGVDEIVVGGDVVPGPMPLECLSILSSLPVPTRFIRGNGENDVLALAGGEMPARVPEAFHEVMRWTLGELSPENLHRLTEWARTHRVEIPGLGKVLFCHATPRDDNEIFTKETPEDRVAPVLAGVDATVVVCGHTHMPFDRAVGDVRVVNAGSVGMPFGEPGAGWLLLGPDVDLRHTSYDLEAADRRIRATGFPQDFEVLAPPAEGVMLAAFESAAV